KECIAIGGCSPGEARITGGHNLKAKFIIHTPGPVYKNGNQGEDALLNNSYWNSLLLAKKHGIRSLSFPAISTGVYGYPKVEACSIAIDTVCEFMDRQEYHLNVYFILFDNESYDLYNNYAATLRAKAL
ncbi:MAG: RNase III inhibitor, partial [Chrysiogenales bacterium]